MLFFNKSFIFCLIIYLYFLCYAKSPQSTTLMFVNWGLVLFYYSFSNTSIIESTSYSGANLLATLQIFSIVDTSSSKSSAISSMDLFFTNFLHTSFISFIFLHLLCLFLYQLLVRVVPLPQIHLSCHFQKVQLY